MKPGVPAATPNRLWAVALVAVKIALPAILLWLVVRRIEWSTVAELAARMSVWVVTCAVVLITAQNLLAAMRWWLITLRLPGKPLGFPIALRLLYVSVFVNQVLPSSIGGDAVRIWLAYRNGYPLASAAKSVLLDRILTMLGLVLLIVFALPFLNNAVPRAPGVQLFASSVTLIALGILGLSLLRLLAPYLERFGRLRRLVSFLMSVREFLLSWRSVAPPLLSAMAGFTMMTLIVFAFARGLGVALSFTDCLVLCPPIFFLAALPVSIAGWGMRETAMIVALGYAGVPAEAALVLSVALGIIVLLGSLPGALFAAQFRPGGLTPTKAGKTVSS
jgi:glycosyltransferase 2 family protein